MLYKGYIETKGKQSIEPLKGRTSFKTYDEIKGCKSYAGILANDVILVDIDDTEQSEILMDIVEDLQLNCRVYQTTRGRHFLFKNNGVKKCSTGIKLACGLTADIKVGGKNTYEVIKIDGVERFIEWDTENGKYDELPKFIHPINTKIDLYGLRDGDGRDSSLFSYILDLNKANFSKNDVRETIQIANKYVLADPLSDEDIERITRDDAFPADDSLFFTDKGKFLHNNFANFIKKECNVKRVNGRLHVYQDGVYVDGVRFIEQAMIKYIPTLSAAQRAETYKYLEIIGGENVEVADANMIAFKNGIYDITTGELKPFSDDIVITNQIPWNYNPNAYSELADNTLNRLACHDKTIRALLEEVIGYCYYRTNELSKAFCFVGDHSNGKSTFLTMVKNVLGKENTSALNLEELDERFSTVMMFGKLANIGDDISDEFLHGKIISTFKKVVSGNEIKAENKGVDGFTYEPYVKLLFSANDVPRTKDKTGAVLRRLVIIPLRGKFTKNDPDFDPFIIYKLKDEEVMEYLINIGIEGLKRVLTNNEFTKSAAVDKELKEYETNNNPMLGFLEERPVEDIIDQTTSDVFTWYGIYCLENGFVKCSQTAFSRELCRRCNLVSKPIRVDGKLIRVYQKNVVTDAVTD